MHTTLNGDPLGYFAHSQNFTNEEEIIIVSSNSADFPKGRAFLEKIDNTKYKFGKIYTSFRDNIGYSFGAYNFAYQLFKNKYDFYIFTEDDISIYKENSLIDALKFWDQTPKCGFVPFVEKTKISKYHREALLIQNNGYVSCHGGIGMSSNEVLSELNNKNGCLPHYSLPDQSYDKQIQKGEILFTYKIKELGYNFADIPREYIFTAPSYDLMRGIKIKKFPNFLQKLYFLIISKGLIPILFKILVWMKIK
jgi:hypothetical protein